MAIEKTWKIRDQMPDGSWGDEREVTLAQFRAEHAAKTAKAMAVFRANTSSLKG